MILRLVVFLYCLLLPVISFAGNDGFNEANKIDTEHFTLYYQDGVDFNSLLSQLIISKTDQLLANQALNTSSPTVELGSMIEILFARASDVLDMHIYSLKANIKVYTNQAALTDYYNNRFHARIPCTGYGFYLDEDKTIYMSAENFRREILGHEMGHAIMSRYFVVQPSVKVQEVLAGYIEYQLRKSNK